VPSNQLLKTKKLIHKLILIITCITPVAGRQISDPHATVFPLANEFTAHRQKFFFTAAKHFAMTDRVRLHFTSHGC
jgi:hypothetical protein